MYCRICGESIPDDSVFCPRCGREVLPSEQTSPAAGASPLPAGTAAPCAPKTCETRIFSFPDGTLFDQAQPAVNAWLAGQQIHILDARFTADAVLLAGTMVPALSCLEVDWLPQAGAAPYQLGIMLDSRSEFSLFRSKAQPRLQRQFDRWHRDHPETEVAGKQDIRLSLGWSSTLMSLFFFR